MDLLRFTTAGSVDDGKSTLIGRLLYDSKSIFEDQLDQVEEASRREGGEGVNLALLTDGLRAEREQKITIDVAYRYFATPRRKFIIADTPGHIQYTRNMVTGASTAELAIILIDARNGTLTQSKRHAFIASLLGIPHLVVAINKMDLVEWSEDVYEGVVSEFSSFAEKLGIDDLTFIPMSALLGDNVVEGSSNMTWYDGTTLLHHLEHVNVGANRNLVDFRFPVQHVIRPNQDYRGYAGRVASGAVRPGEEVLILPSGQRTTVASIDTFDGSLEEARNGDSVVIRTTDERDISRGDMIVRPMNVPTIADELDATVCWMSDEPLQEGDEFWIRHTTRETRAVVREIVYRIDVDTLHREDAEALQLNDIARIRFSTAKPLFFDRYELNRETGAFILVDVHSNATSAAGMIRGEVRDVEGELKREGRHRTGEAVSPDVVWEEWNIPLAEREDRTGHRAAVIWFTGLSGSGKSTIAGRVERTLFERGIRTMLLDGDQVRHGLSGDLGFGERDRRENIRRVAHVAGLFARQGSLTLCSFVSPYSADRDLARRLAPQGRFVEVHVDTPLDVCEERDTKGLYARARAGEIRNLTGVDAPYEVPDDPELRVTTVGKEVEDVAREVLAYLDRHVLIG